MKTGTSGAGASAYGEESLGGLAAFRKGGKYAKDDLLGTAQAPIHMVAVEGGHFKEQLWRTFRTLGLAFLLISGVGALIEDRGISKGTIIIHLQVPLENSLDMSVFCNWINIYIMLFILFRTWSE